MSIVATGNGGRSVRKNLSLVAGFVVPASHFLNMTNINEAKTVCPKCAEDVKPEASICKHCGSKITPVSADKVKKRSVPVLKWFIFICIAGIITSSVISSTSQMSSQSSAPDHCSMAYVKSQNYVEDVLKSPKSADFPMYEYTATDIGDGGCEVSGYVDAENSFGANIRSYWTTTVRFSGGSTGDSLNWTLEKMVVDGEVVYP